MMDNKEIKKDDFEKKDSKVDSKKEKRDELKTGILLLYLVIAFAITAMATEKQLLTYGQISMLYLPMFFVFIYWLIKRRNNPDNNHNSALGTIVGICMCAFIIIATLAINLSNFLS